MVDEMKKQKSSYEPGVWNASSVLLGGLGNFTKLIGFFFIRVF
jgi:hypothetical protein